MELQPKVGFGLLQFPPSLISMSWRFSWSAFRTFTYAFPLWQVPSFVSTVFHPQSRAPSMSTYLWSNNSFCGSWLYLMLQNPSSFTGSNILHRMFLLPWAFQYVYITERHNKRLVFFTVLYSFSFAFGLQLKRSEREGGGDQLTDRQRTRHNELNRRSDNVTEWHRCFPYD